MGGQSRGQDRACGGPQCSLCLEPGWEEREEEWRRGGSKLCGGVVLTLKTQGPGGGTRGERWGQTGHVGVGAGDKQVLREEGWLRGKESGRIPGRKK